MNNNILKKTIIRGAITFWLFVYISVVIIRFLEIGFDVVGYKDTFLSLFLRPFFSALIYYHPLYLLPLILVGYSTIQKKSAIKILFFLFAIILSATFFFITFGGIILSHTGTEMKLEYLLILVAIQLICYFILYFILQTYTGEKIVTKLLQISITIFLVAFGYISFSAYVASRAGLILEKMSQDAIKAEDVSLCEKILEESGKRHVSEFRIGSVVGDNYIECVQQIAVATKNIELCRKIDIGFADCECIGMIGAATSNPNLCYQEVTMKKNTVGLDFYTEACLEAYNSFIKNKTPQN
jgi:hypothetical protein